MLNNAHAVPFAARKMTGAGRQQWYAWLALVVVVGLVVLFYLSLSMAVSADPLLMPLDDTYIHFQYARQIAQGQPMVYHDGDPATSGGTSLLYPPLLAVGYLLGFTEWELAYWALGTGVLCFVGSVWLVYLIGRRVPMAAGGYRYARRHALLVALAFAVSGPFVWAALSGMETALFVFTVLLTLYAVQHDRLALAVGAAIVTSLTRPEGVAVAAIAMLGLALCASWPVSLAGRAKRATLLALPVLAALVQPAINALATGSTTSSGMVAKSHLTNTSVPLTQRLRTVLDFFVRMWFELLTGESRDWGQFVPWLLVVMALSALAVGIVRAWRRRRMTLSLIVLAWMLALTAGVATLDTAFWQFKRYQLPVMALFFPLGAWGTALYGAMLRRGTWWRWAQWAVPATILAASLVTTFTFLQKYVANVRVVRDQQVPMARWVRDNLPDGARVAVHDVGLMGYFSEHALYDVVGLALPGPAESWRQGPGAIYEHMAHSEYRPDYFAIYPNVQGLSYLADAGVMGEVLAEFPLTLPKHNVAAAADYQAVYTADWSTAPGVEQVAQTTTLSYLDRFDDVRLVDWIDVANLESEAAHGYEWWQDDQPAGFVTELYTHVYHACGLSDEAVCWVTDGGRVLTGGERFTLNTIPGEDLLLVTRVHGRYSASLQVTVEHVRHDFQVQPQIPGRWVEVATLIPGEKITGDTTVITVRGGSAGGAYAPYYHWAFQGAAAFEGASQMNDVVATFDFTPFVQLFDGSKGRLNLVAYDYITTSTQIELDVSWFLVPSVVPPDGLFFIHLYNSDGLDEEPIAQIVTRPVDGVLPLANWLTGEINETYSLSLPDDLPAGEYVIAVGFFDAATGARYEVRSGGLPVNDNRLYIGEITVEEFSGED